MKSEELDECILDLYHYKDMLDKTISRFSQIMNQDGFKDDNKLNLPEILWIEDKISEMKMECHFIGSSIADINEMLPPSWSFDEGRNK